MVQIAIVEPYEPDAHWISLLLEEIDLSAHVIRYATDAHALDEWGRSRPAIDLIIVTDVLPMRTLQEFVDAALTLYPGIPIIAVGEAVEISACPDVIIGRYRKPLSPDDLRSIYRSTFEAQQKEPGQLLRCGKSAQFTSLIADFARGMGTRRWPSAVRV